MIDLKKLVEDLDEMSEIFITAARNDGRVEAAIGYHSAGSAIGAVKESIQKQMEGLIQVKTFYLMDSNKTLVAGPFTSWFDADTEKGNYAAAFCSLLVVSKIEYVTVDEYD